MPKRKNADTKQRLLRFLADGQFHSGEELGRALDVSRAAIWKASQYIHELGLPLESITGRGYRIREGIELLEQERIQAQLSVHNQKQLDHLYIADEVDSTNHCLLSQCRKLDNQRAAVLAERQTEGRGRRGKEWVSPFGRNIYLSMLVPINKDPSQLTGLSPAIAISICKTLNELGIYGTSVKWPNDILYNYKKLAGILIEMQAQAHDYCQVVIGIGLNLDLSQGFQNNINQNVADVKTITGAKPERNKIAGSLLNNLLNTIEQFSIEGLTPILNRLAKAR